MPRIPMGGRAPLPLMSGSENSQPLDADQTLRANEPLAESAVLDMVAELREELASLKGQVIDLRGQLGTSNSTPEPDGPEPAHTDSAEEPELSILDAESFAADLEMAMAHPVLDSEDMSAEMEEEPVDEAELAEQSAEALRQHPELSGIIDAIELQTSGVAAPTESDLPSESDEGLSSEEMDALMSATSQIGSAEDPDLTPGPVAVPTVVEASVPVPAPIPVTPSSPPAAPVPAPGTMMSEEEIMNLLIEAKGDPRVIPVDPQADPQASEIEAELVSADEIKAMLGVKDEHDDSVPELVQAPEPETAPEPVALELVESVEPEETGVAEDFSGLDLDSVDPSAVAKVPGGLAASALALPVCVVDDRLHCLCIEPFDLEALAEISKAVGMEVIPHAGEPARVLSELRLRYGANDEAAARTPDPVAPPSLVQRLLKNVKRKSA